MPKVGTYKKTANITLGAKWLEVQEFFAKRYPTKWQDGRLSVTLRRSQFVFDPFDYSDVPQSSPWTELIIEPRAGKETLELTMTLLMHTDSKGQVFDDIPTFNDLLGLLQVSFPAPERGAAEKQRADKKTGAPRLEERPDWEEKVERVQRIDAKLRSTLVTLEAACRTEKISPKTYRNIKRRMEELKANSGQ